MLAPIPVRLSIPFPPSTNRLWRHWQGRTLISKEGRAYRTAVGQVVAVARPEPFGRTPVRLSIAAWMPDSRRRDLDNLLKATQDALGAARLYEDDRQIVDLRIRRAGLDRARPRLEIQLEAA